MERAATEQSFNLVSPKTKDGTVTISSAQFEGGAHHAYAEMLSNPLMKDGLKMILI